MHSHKRSAGVAVDRFVERICSANVEAWQILEVSLREVSSLNITIWNLTFVSANLYLWTFMKFINSD